VVDPEHGAANAAVLAQALDAVLPRAVAAVQAIAARIDAELSADAGQAVDGLADGVRSAFAALAASAAPAPAAPAATATAPTAKDA